MNFARLLDELKVAWESSRSEEENKAAEKQFADALNSVQSLNELSDFFARQWTDFPVSWVMRAYDRAGVIAPQDIDLLESHLEYLNFVGGPDYQDERTALIRRISGLRSRGQN
jgi:hypothetical protein